MKIIAALLLFLSVPTPFGFALEQHRAGGVRTGETIDWLLWDTRIEAELVDLKSEGFFTPLLKITVYGQRDALRAFIGAADRQFIVRDIEVRDSRFRTAKGIHVGSTLGDLRKAYGNLSKVGGEGTVGARVESLSMTFNLGGDVYDDPRYRAHDLSDVPGDVPIVSIWIN